MNFETSARAVFVEDQRTKCDRKLKTVESDFKPLIVVFDVGEMSVRQRDSANKCEKILF